MNKSLGSHVDVLQACRQSLEESNSLARSDHFVKQDRAPDEGQTRLVSKDMRYHCLELCAIAHVIAPHAPYTKMNMKMIPLRAGRTTAIFACQHYPGRLIRICLPDMFGVIFKACDI